MSGLPTTVTTQTHSIGRLNYAKVCGCGRGEELGRGGGSGGYSGPDELKDIFFGSSKKFEKKEISGEEMKCCIISDSGEEWLGIR